MLKIPIASDTPPPLVLSLRSVAAEAAAAKAARQQGENEKLSASGDKRQMFWWLIGGTTLFAVIVTTVLMAMLGGDKAKPATVLQPPPPPPPAVTIPANDPMAELERSDAVFLAKAEAMAKQFMEATSIQSLLPLVRNPNLAEGRMKKFYPEGEITAPGMSAFNTNKRVIRVGPIIGVMVRNKDFAVKPLYFFETSSEIKIDWESWVGWSEISWDDFLATKPQTPKLFRVTLSAVQYYNFFFADEQRWQSYRIESPDRDHSLYGYVERNSSLNARLLQHAGMKQMALTLALRFPAEKLSPNQVIIDSFVAEGWVLKNEPTP